MNSLGPSLKHLVDFCGGQVSAITALKVGIQLTTRLAHVHTNRITHQDLKPHNLAIGLGDDTNLINLIDFGVSEFFLNKKRHHIVQTDVDQSIGTLRYMSVNAHK